MEEHKVRYAEQIDAKQISSWNKELSGIYIKIEGIIESSQYKLPEPYDLRMPSNWWQSEMKSVWKSRFDRIHKIHTIERGLAHSVVSDELTDKLESLHQKLQTILSIFPRFQFTQEKARLSPGQLVHLYEKKILEAEFLKKYHGGSSTERFDVLQRELNQIFMEIQQTVNEGPGEFTAASLVSLIKVLRNQPYSIENPSEKWQAYIKTKSESVFSARKQRYEIWSDCLQDLLDVNSIEMDSFREIADSVNRCYSKLKHLQYTYPNLDLPKERDFSSESLGFHHFFGVASRNAWYAANAGKIQKI